MFEVESKALIELILVLRISRVNQRSKHSTVCFSLLDITSQYDLMVKKKLFLPIHNMMVVYFKTTSKSHTSYLVPFEIKVHCSFIIAHIILNLMICDSSRVFCFFFKYVNVLSSLQVLNDRLQNILIFLWIRQQFGSLFHLV